MSLVTGTVRTGDVAAVAERPLFNGKPLVLLVLLMCSWYVGVRLYEQVFGWYAGLDSFAPEFTTYWMTLLYV
jgi:methane/ammonia monooxygenase subunit C